MSRSIPTFFFADSLVEKCLRLEARGGVPTHVMITVPTIIQAGRPFSATVSLLDEHAMPAVPTGEAFVISLKSPDSPPIPISFEPHRSAVCRVDGLNASEEGFMRLEAVLADDTFFSNPALVTTEDRPGIFWGDPHLHTVLSDCHPDRCRTRNLAYMASRYAYGLDFVAIADHVSCNCRGTKGKWRDNLAACELFNDPDRFSALYCYEASLDGGLGGDNNVYLREPAEAYVDPWPDGLNTKQLAEAVGEHGFIVPHHTTRTDKHGEIPPAIYPGERMMPVVEIHSKWGTSEYRGNPDALIKVHPGPSYVLDLLSHGYRMGFIAGTDSHTTLTFCRSFEAEHIRSLPGLTAVMAKHNRREELFDAIRSRNCYAVKGERIFLETSVGDLRMGKHTARVDYGSTLEIRARAAAESNIERVEIVRNGKVVHAQCPGAWTADVAWEDADDPTAVAHKGPAAERPSIYYYVRVTASSGAQAWSSPCFFDL